MAVMKGDVGLAVHRPALVSWELFHHLFKGYNFFPYINDLVENSFGIGGKDTIRVSWSNRI